MYLSDIASEAYYSHSSHRLPRTRSRGNFDSSTLFSGSQSGIGGPARRTSHLHRDHHRDRTRSSPSAAPTSIPLDDNFDAYTTEVPTEWHADDPDGDGGGNGDGHTEYDRDESVSGYRNYVTEMERMLAGQMENAARAQERQYHQYQERLHQQSQSQNHDQIQDQNEHRGGLNRSVSLSESGRGSSKVGGGRRSLANPQQLQLPLSPVPPPENAREVSGKKGRIELVEQRIIEDSPVRTISLWRERVAANSAGGTRNGEDDGADIHGNARSRGHRRVPSSGANSVADTRLRRVVSERPRYAESMEGSGMRNGSVRGIEGGKSGRATYERSEYMVSYKQATTGGMPKELFSPISQARDVMTPTSPTLSRMHSPPSPSLRRHAHRKSLERSEYMMSYPQTPPLTDSQASSSSPGPTKGRNQNDRSHEEASTQRVTSTSSVEVILSSCDPSLLHIAPILYDLGIKRVDHLRAIARLGEGTRDREVKEEALRRGVTVLEWAIFLDKLQSL
ncbi:hypothetical protein DICSQDRAFT_179290 [Dichomitus squalens LYAD-421 SS1]|uniref:Uncharacterized protein n=1 Tax=Dichomitus squalens TaxID=114155 RepID=A0A4Q9MRX4_9APHY|nr:uncharacterized protein DICSQDRAFT_179290 [Dichomitus squalens LYAD-421 SS1]EJF63291.1 hypothetical protein DICSQDRAFT_179290 [Dichomitus squalens LYAD-421 SS1]TBU29987.1 hypothetical protein BD311DRAFT_248722 [Dichomitus squalens]